MSWFLKVLKNYAVFSGRARRKEYWFFVLFYAIFFMVAAFLDGLTGTYNAEIGMGVLTGILILALLVPNIAVTIRRLHDTDKSGWWILIAFVPFVGGIVLLIFMVMGGTQGDNQYGPDPLAEG
jgi:uncharacterized membrane protein YhaH (DUF805 family)